MVTTFWLRILVYTVLPVVAGAAHVVIDRSVTSDKRRWEVMLLYLFSLGVGIAGLSNFFGHFFLSDIVAQSIGWAPGSPFQLEMGFTNLALGVLGVGAVSRRDGFREATVTAVAVVGVGATIVHLMDIVQAGNVAPGNTIQNVGNLLRPALLIAFLAASRRAERQPESDADSARFEAWRGPRMRAAWWLGAAVATGFGVGFFAARPVLGTALGLMVGAVMAVATVRRAG